MLYPAELRGPVRPADRLVKRSGRELDPCAAPTPCQCHPGRVTTVAEDVVRLLLDPTTGRFVVDRTSLDRAIGGALLLDLSARGRVQADGDGSRARLMMVAGPTGDDLLDAALLRLGPGPVRAQRAVEKLARGTREPVLERLERLERLGVLRRERSSLFGIFPRTSWTVVDGSAATLRGAVASVLVTGTKRDGHLALLISLLHAVRAEHKVVDGPRRQVRERAAEIAAGDWAGVAVRRAVQAVQAAATAVVLAASTAASAGGS